ncbi:PAS domain-containing sensor histidine kinase [Geomesophilobacter sediminis]|uniref:PAS domain S-box protein n=1 Tax=Geomesophilobacter sediminis TaxID=2798584 RepID=A0A8J7INZ5_9BACT|nr:PAS domain-containing sensor histidine kinase [Geomesophilobacter sediminis]MBJ6723919.1 PAS domain S-box protein [Geomesophilobacter sediminis]
MDSNCPIVENANDCIISLNSQGCVVGWNRKAATLFGYRFTELQDRPVTLILPQFPTLGPGISQAAAPVQMTGVKKGDVQFPVEVSVGSYSYEKELFHTLVARDVSERLERDEFISEALRMAKSPTRKDYLDSVVRLLQIWSGCSCVGIRILDADDKMPFESYVGFDREFWEWENWLSTKEDCCICTRIITGTTEEQDAAITTAEGSFRTDNMERFLSALPDPEKDRFRGNCPRFGYLSIAFTPIQYRGTVYGGLHITDEREAMLPPSKVRFVESIATHIGETIYRIGVEEALQKSELRYRNLFEESPIAVLEADVSDAMQSLERLRDAGVTDYSSYFVAHPEAAKTCGAGISVIELNHSMLELYQAETAEQLIEFLRVDGNYDTFLRLIAGSDREPADVVTSVTTMKGNLKFATPKLSRLGAATGCCGRVIISLHDVTERKRSETALQESHGRLRQLAAHLESVREEERVKMSREVHDELGQMVAALKFDVSFLKETAPLSGPQAHKIDDMDANVTEMIRTVQRISAELRPKLLDDLGLVPAMEWQIKDFAQRTGIACSHKMSPSLPPLVPECSTAIFRIFKEALTNIQRHANASKVMVKLHQLKQEIVLVVTDNGKGVAVEDIFAEGSFGLMGMRERAFLCSGKVVIDSPPGQGTTVRLHIPLVKGNVR